MNVRSHIPQLTLLFGLGLSGCSATQKVYEGPELDPTQASWMILYNTSERIQSRRIDGVSVSNWIAKRVEMKPGKHTIVYDLHGYNGEDLAAANAAARALPDSTKSKDFPVRYVVHEYQLDFETQPGWVYEVAMTAQPLDADARPEHCIWAAPATFKAGQREPEPTLGEQRALLTCAPALRGHEGIYQKTVNNPNYKEPEKKKDKDKDKDAKGKKK